MPQPVQNACNFFVDFTSRIKSLALTKSWKVEVEEHLFVVSPMSYIVSLISYDYIHINSYQIWSGVSHVAFYF